MGLEIERKFLIVLPDTELLLAKPDISVKKITQTYLTPGKSGCERRIREIVCGGETKYVYTEKVFIAPGVRREDEREITRDDYLRLRREAYSELEKVRYAFPYMGHTFEIDVYPTEYGVGRNDPPIRGIYAVMEAELGRMDERIDFPSDIKIVRELTGTGQYTNQKLARRIKQKEPQ